MEGYDVAASLDKINYSLENTNDILKKGQPENNKAFEIFKTVAPDLWEKYREIPNGNFEEVLEDAVVFSRKAARAFRSHELRAKQIQDMYEKQYPGESESD